VTYVSNPSAVAILDVERFPTGNLPVATIPLSGLELMALVQNGSNCYIQASALAGFFNFSAGVSDLGNTAGQTGLTQPKLVLAGGSNVTLSQQLGTDGGTVWINGATSQQSVQAGSFTAAGNTVSGSTMTIPAGLVVSGGDNITVGLSAGSLLIQGPSTFNQSVQAGSYTLAGNTASGSTLTVPGGLVINASDNLTAGLSNGSLVLRAPSPVQNTVTVVLSGNIAGGNASTMTFADQFFIAGYQNLSVGGTSNTLAFFVGQSTDIASFYVVGNTTLGTSFTSFPRLSINASDNITAGLTNGSLVLIGAGGGAGGNLTVSAGTSSGSSQSLVFADSNGLEWGLSGGTLTARDTSPPSLIVSASNTSALMTALSFSNKDNVSFNLTGSAGSYQIAAEAKILVMASKVAVEGTALSFSNGDGITFYVNNTAPDGVLISGHVPAQSAQRITLTVTGNTTLGSTMTVQPNLVINASNNITAGLSNGSLVLVGNSGGGGAGSLNISAGTTSQNLTRLVFSNSNNLSFGLNGSTITGSASYNIPAQTTQAGSYTLAGNTVSGSTMTVPAGLVINASDNITAGLSNGSLVLKGNSGGGGGGGTQSYWLACPGPGIGSSNVTNSAGILFLQPFVMALHGTANYAQQAISLAVNTGNTTHSGAITLSMGLYSLTGSTLSLASSGSYSFSWSISSNNGLNQLTGLWNVSVPLPVNATPGNYWVAMHHNSTRQLNSATVGVYMIQAPSIKGRWPTGGPALSEGVNLPGWGYYKNSFTTAMPSSLSISNNNIWENNLQFMAPFMYTSYLT
jgi:hypothetical protein